jgi:hypothetical protein
MTKVFGISHHLDEFEPAAAFGMETVTDHLWQAVEWVRKQDQDSYYMIWGFDSEAKTFEHECTLWWDDVKREWIRHQ